MSRKTVAGWLSWPVATLTVVAVLTACAIILVAVRPQVLPGLAGSSAPDAGPTPTALASPSSPASAGQTAGVIGPAVPAGSGVIPNAASLTRRIAAVPTTRLGAVGGEVTDLSNGSVLYDSRAATPMMPGSTLKLLTMTAALEELGPWHRFTTRVVSPAPGNIILVGGGDPYLASDASSGSATYPTPVTSATLAAETASALKARGITTVTLGYDDSLFTGPSWNAAWPSGYRDQVATISPLWIDQGRDPKTKRFTRTPSATAAHTFATQLARQGITVRDSAPGRVTAPPDAATLAQVQSWPLATIVERTLLESDNSAAEVLLRQVALAAGRPATFSGGVDAVEHEVSRLGIQLDGVHMVDGSGLARADTVTATQLTALIRLAASRPELRPLLDGLPVAGVTGTLASRFYVTGATPGRGQVHAKTGTLTHVSSVAGYVRTESGALLAFAFLVNGASPGTKVTKTSVGTNDWNMSTYLDQVSGAIAGCGCS